MKVDSELLPKPPMRRRTPEQIRQTLQRLSQSGLSQREFAKQEGISLASLQNWRKRFASSAAAPPRLIEVSLPKSSGSERYRLELPNGGILSIPGGFRPQEVRQLIELLR